MLRSSFFLLFCYIVSCSKLCHWFRSWLILITFGCVFLAFLSIMVCPVRLLICCTSAPCSQLLHSGLFFVYVDSDPRSLLISFLIILGVACHVFDLCWFWLCTFFDPLLLFFWDGPSAKGVWRLPNVHTVNCRWSSPHCACYAVSVRVNLLWMYVMIQWHSLLVVGCDVVV